MDDIFGKDFNMDDLRRTMEGKLQRVSTGIKQLDEDIEKCLQLNKQIQAIGKDNK